MPVKSTLLDKSFKILERIAVSPEPVTLKKRLCHKSGKCLKTRKRTPPKMPMQAAPSVIKGLMV